MRLLAPLLSVFLVACSSVGASFVCTSDAQCTVGSTPGVCEMTTHFCSVVAMDCPSGFRYDRSAGDGLAGECASSDAGVAVDGPMPSTDLAMGDDGPPSPCATFLASGGLACQDFEEPVVAPWDLYTVGGGTFHESNGHVHRGALAAHSVTPTVTTELTAAQISINGMPASAPIYARAFVYVENPPTTGLELFGWQQTNASGSMHALAYAPDGGLVLDDEVLGTSGSYTLPTGQWVCIELELVPATAGSIKVKINDQYIPALTLTGDTLSTPVTDQFVAGAYYDVTSTVSGYGFWLDDLAISSKSITCAE